MEHLKSSQQLSFKYTLNMHSNVEKISHVSLVYCRTKLKQHTLDFVVKILIVIVAKVITLIV